MEIKEIIQLRGLRREWENIVARVSIYLQTVPKEFIGVVGGPSQLEDTTDLYMELKSLEEDYNELVSRTSTLLKSFEIRKELAPHHIYIPTHYDIPKRTKIYEGETKVFLQRVAKESSKIIEIIDGLTLAVALSPEKEKELEALENKVKEEIEPSLPLFSSDLIESIRCFRNGDFLGSTLICGRVILFLIEKVKSQILNISKIEPSQQWNEVIEFLKEKGIIESKEEIGKRILETIKLYRHKYAHTVGTYPSLEESLLIISGTITLVGKIAKNIKEFSFLKQ